MIRVISIGRKHEPWVEPGISRYQKRLQKPWDIKWDLLPHSSENGSQARQTESASILSRLQPADYVILLDERGKLFDSPTMSKSLDQSFASGKNVVMVIGGAYGVSDELRERANLTWSLSPLVLPHQLVRLVLVEQIYRWQQIDAGRSYHHE